MILLQCGVHNNFIRWRSLSNAFKLISRYTIAPLYLELIMIAKSQKVVRLQCKIKALLQNFGEFFKVLPTFIFQAFIIFQKMFWEIIISFLDFCMRTLIFIRLTNKKVGIWMQLSDRLAKYVRLILIFENLYHLKVN